MEDAKSEVETVEGAVTQLRYHHTVQSKLCSELENLADNLPTLPDAQLCLSLARQIFPVVRQAHEFEETQLFPLLQTLQHNDEKLDQSLERLRFEHWEDESFAEELSETMREYGMTQDRSVGEKLSYMLRGFFEGLRRHMAFETEHLLPMLSQAPSSPTVQMQS